MEEHVAGIIINPRLRTPVLVGWDGHEVHIHRWETEDLERGKTTDEVEKEGEGYFGSDRASDLTGLPRVHTPSGVYSKGMGFGTCLYTGLCLVAHGASEGRYTLPVYADGDGICSMEDDRSASASGWWDRAVDLGLASHDAFTDERENVDIDLDTDDLECVDEDTLRSALDAGDEGDVSITHVNQINVDADVTVSLETYLYETAYESSLILCYFDDPIDVRFGGARQTKKLWESIQEDSGYAIGEFDEDVFLAMDVRGLGKQAINLLAVIARTQQVDEYVIEAMRIRNEYGLDPDAKLGARQQLLTFTPNGRDRDAAKEALDLTVAARRRVGWNRLKALP